MSGGGTPDGGESLHHDELPLPDYDHLPIGSLEGRIRSLDADGLQALLDYEQAHGNRLPVTEILTRRLEAVREGAELSEDRKSTRLNSSHANISYAVFC